MPGDGAAAEAAVSIAAHLDVPYASRGGQKKYTIGKKTKLASLAKQMRLHTKVVVPFVCFNLPSKGE